MKFLALKSQLDELADFYNSPSFIFSDPISIPHRFSKKEDIEIAGFLASILAWGNRKSIIKSAEKWINLMDCSPYDFVVNHQESDLKALDSFVHRTFNGVDAQFFINSLHYIYDQKGGLEQVFTDGYLTNNSIFGAIVYFREIFLQTPHLQRSIKHVSNPSNGSAAKRINMYLRWMVRNDARGVDFGLWKNIPMSALKLPLDVHTSRVARSLGLLSRKSNDWRAVDEVSNVLYLLDSIDPIKYDFALFGLSINQK